MALGPGVAFSKDETGFNFNVSLGGDFPVGHGWSIVTDVTVDMALATGQLGLAYWFM